MILKYIRAYGMQTSVLKNKSVVLQGYILKREVQNLWSKHSQETTRTRNSCRRLKWEEQQPIKIKVEIKEK